MRRRIMSLLLALLMLPAAWMTAAVGEDVPETREETEETAEDAGEREEAAETVLLEDEENGLWRYEGSGLKVEIRRSEEKVQKKTRIWCTAEIWASPEYPLQALMTEAQVPGTKLVSPDLIVEKYNPVFAMSDDLYGIRLQKKNGKYRYDFHGVVIRDGQVLAEKTRNSAKKRAWPNLDTLAVYPDGSMKTYVCDEYTPEEYLQMGAVHVFAFGPKLISDGEINPEVLDPKYYPYNEPRVAIGMVEPYHYVCILALGRPKDKYAGVHLDWLAERMQEMGCTEALNLDGGATATMFFNGKVILSGQVKTVKKETVPVLRSQGSLIAFGAEKTGE